MNNYNNPVLKKNAQNLRRNMTKEEKHLWYDFLKNLDVTINRQKVIGNYILDFYCAKYKIAIELDGSQHYEKDGKDKDILRDKTLKDIGITVLRYSNYEINHDFEGVCQDILQHMK